MTSLAEFLQPVRQLYLDHLVAVLNAADQEHDGLHIEPALRNSSGELVRDGDPLTPVRIDYIRKGSNEFGHATRGQFINFKSFEIEVGENELLTISPFQWNSAKAKVTSVDLEACNAAITCWFDTWFDVEDKNEVEADGTFNVVHYVQRVEVGLKSAIYEIDFGSASTECFSDFLDAVFGAGALQLEIYLNEGVRSSSNS